MAEREPLAEPEWYAVHTLAASEGLAARNLTRRGFWTWFPFDRYRVKIERQGRRRLDTWIERPHFSRYIFVALRFASEAIGDINDTDGVARVVCGRYSRIPFRIPNMIMDALMDSALVQGDDARHSALMREIIRTGDQELTQFLNRLGRRAIKARPMAA